jgi:hypothetical protein
MSKYHIIRDWFKGEKLPPEPPTSTPLRIKYEVEPETMYECCKPYIMKDGKKIGQLIIGTRHEGI